MSLCSSIFRPFPKFLALLIAMAATLGYFPVQTLAQDPPAETQSVSSPMSLSPMTPSFARLAEPDVADRLGLNEEQRAQIATILDRRAEALETAADDQRRAILEASEAELAALLDDDQLARWVALADEVVNQAVKLQFNFRFAPWADVLSWFAEQAGLSLVLDAPPPGTFNYSDTKDYTPAEAIDLLNGVLLTKGYTLIRRERMLLVVDTLDGIPEELVPEIDIDELDKRGRFEFVRVTFPLGSRDPQAVDSEISALLGEFGKSILLPQTKQLVVIETAGKMRAIRAIIESIPEPSKPETPKTKEAEKPTLVTYPLNNIDASAAIQTLEAIFGEGKFVHESKTNQLLAYTVPSEQEAVSKTLEQMQAEIPEDRKYDLQIHRLTPGNHGPLLNLLQNLFPSARLSLDTATSNLVAWATPPEQETIRRTIVGLDEEGATPGSRKLKVYRLRKSNPTTLVTLLAPVLPRANITADPASKSIAVFSDDTGHVAVQAAVDALEAAPDDAMQASVQFHPVPREQLDTLQSLLESLVPEAKIRYDDARHSLVVVAIPEDQKTVAETIETVVTDAPEGEKPRLQSYEVRTQKRAAVEAALSALTAELPGIQVLPDSGDNRMLIWARPEQHQVISELLVQVTEDVDPESQAKVVSYPLEFADAASIVSVLQTLVPQAQLVVEATSNQIVAWALQEDHEKIATAIEQVDVEATPRKRLRLMAHPLEKADQTAVLQVLQTLVPGVPFIPNPANNTLIALATEPDQQLVTETIERMQPSLEADKQYRVEIYKLHGADPQAYVNALTPTFPQGRFTADPPGERLIVWATAEDHDTIAPLVERLQKPYAEGEEPQAVVHRLENISPAVAVAALQPVFPEARLQAEPTNQSVVAMATASDQESIRTMLAQLDLKPYDGRRSLEVYALNGAEPTSALTLVQSAFINARVSSNPKSDSLLVWANPEEHQQIAGMIETLQLPEGDRPLPEVHRLEYITPAVAVAALQPLFPQAQLQPEVQNQSVVVVARSADQEAIRAALEKLDVNQKDERRQLVAYQLDGAEPTSATNLVQTAFVNARVIADPKTDSLLVWANSEDHASIREMVDLFAREVPEDRQRTTRAYPLKYTDANVALGVVSPLVPTALMAVDPRGRKLLVTAIPEDHDRVQEAITELETGPSEDLAESLQVYEVENADATVVLTTLQQMYALLPEVRLSLDPLTNKLAVWANPDQHESIAEVVSKFDRLLDPSEELVVQVYPLSGADAPSIRDVVEELLEQHPESRVITDESTDQIIVLAQADEQAVVKRTLEQLQTVKPSIDVIQLRFVEPYSAELAIETLFESNGRGRRNESGPRVDSDPSTGQLFIRGTPEQLAQIRELLGKMGERFVSDQTLGSGRKLRVIPLPNSTIGETLEEVRRLWPQLRSNPIRVVTPSAVAPTLRKSREEQEATPQEDGSNQGSNSNSENPGSEDQTHSNARIPAEILAQVVQLADDDQPEANQPETQASSDATDATENTEPQETPEPATDEEPESLPIVIAISDDNITIASEDLEALDQFETLLKTIVQRAPVGGREFTVFTLTSANAALVAESLEKLFDDGLFGLRGLGNVSIVPDQRLNALIVQASASDLATIEGLIKVLDTDEPLDSLLRTEPRVIKVNNARAIDIEDVLEDVYKTQLTTGGTRPNVSAPRGSSRELRAVFQELSAASAGPEMTLSVDTETNSLIVLAAQPLFEEVQQLVEQLDQAADEPNRVVRVVPLKKTNSEIVQGVLDSLLKDSQRSIRRRR